MIEPLVQYYPGTVVAWTFMALLLLAQVLVADVTGLRRKKPPGAEVEGDHDDFLWRAERAFMNTNETLGAFVLLTLAAVGVAAELLPVNACALGFVVARAGHMACYWADLKRLRSACWIAGTVALFGLALIAFIGI